MSVPTLSSILTDAKFLRFLGLLYVVGVILIILLTLCCLNNLLFCESNIPPINNHLKIGVASGCPGGFKVIPFLSF